MFFDAKVFLTFVDDCRAIGIDCPIVPGLMCINNYGGFVKMTKFCKTRVPDEVRTKMDAIQNDADAIKEYGMEFGASICKELLDAGKVNVLHFYTLNLEKVVYGVLDKVGLSDNALASSNEADANTQIAKGSAWARVGDTVRCAQGQGTVVELNKETGAAVIALEGGEQVTVAKSDYQKVF